MEEMSSAHRETVEEISLLHLGHQGLPSQVTMTYLWLYLTFKKKSGAGGRGGWGCGIYNIYKSSIIHYKYTCLTVDILNHSGHNFSWSQVFKSKFHHKGM